jgi:RHS repeat-associated protein
MHDSILAGNIWQGRGTYDVRLNPTLTGSVTCADITHACSIVGGGGHQTLCRGVLSSEGVQNRFGYAGYRYDHHLAGAERHLYHVRHRVYQAHIGRWATRDPLGYVDGMSLYEYVRSAPIIHVDPNGRDALKCIGCILSAGGGAVVCGAACITGGVWTGGAACYGCIMAYLGAVALLAGPCAECLEWFIDLYPPLPPGWLDEELYPGGPRRRDYDYWDPSSPHPRPRPVPYECPWRDGPWRHL